MTLHVQLYNYHALRKLTVPRHHVASRIRFSRRRRSRFNMHKLITGRRPGARQIAPTSARAQLQRVVPGHVASNAPQSNTPRVHTIFLASYARK